MMRADNRPPVEVISELRDTFTPLCVEVADLISTDMSPDLSEQVALTPVHVLKHSVALVELPWDMLVDVDVPERPAQLEPEDIIAFMDEVDEAYLTHHPEARAVDSDYIRIRTNAEHIIFDEDFDATAWRQNEQYVAALDSGERDNIASCRSSQRYNGRKGLYLYGLENLPQVDRFLYVHNSFVPAHNKVTNDIVIPVGEYGEEFARKLLRIALIAQAQIQTYLTESAEEVTEGREELLYTYTARANERGEATPESTMLTLQEGVLSVVQSMALLTLQKVEGYDTGEELLQALADGGLTERLARYAAMGMVGPMAMLGKYVPGAVEKTPGGVQFSGDFEALLKKCRGIYAATFLVKEETKHESGSREDEEKAAKAIGRICPVAGKDGGIDQITIAMTDRIVDDVGLKLSPQVRLQIDQLK
jgi:hypothetical protein